MRIIQVQSLVLNCVNCRYFQYTTGEMGYSELTPGSDIEIGCLKSHWYNDNTETTALQFQENMNSANDCPDFVISLSLRIKKRSITLDEVNDVLDEVEAWEAEGWEVTKPEEPGEPGGFK